MESRNSWSATQRQLLREVVNDGKTITAVSRKPGELYRTLIDSAEQSNRMAEFRRAHADALKEGLSPYDANLKAAQASRDLIDFRRAGTLIRGLNRYMPFLNAGIQGISSNTLALRRNPKKFMGRWFSLVVVPTMFERAYNTWMESDEEFRQMPGWRKDFFWNFKIDEGRWLSIPKPFELGVLASGIGRVVDRAQGDEHAFDDYPKSLAKSIVPFELEGSSFAGVAGSIAIEQQFNWDAFTGKPIVSHWEESKALEERDGVKYASQLGQKLQGAMNVDARRIDHVMRSQFGYAGRGASMISDTFGDDPPTHEQLLGLLTGVVSGTPATQLVDVRWLLEQEKKHARRDTRFHRLIDNYYDAVGKGERQSALNKLLDYAAKRRERGDAGKPIFKPSSR